MNNSCLLSPIEAEAHTNGKPKAARKLVDYYSCDKAEQISINETDNCKQSTFEFPPPPPLNQNMPGFEVPPFRATSPCSQESSNSSDEDSDSEHSDSYYSRRKPVVKLRERDRKGGYWSDCTPVSRSKQRSLPPIGVFWDIENCQVPKGRSAVLIAQEIRRQFFKGYTEAEFLVVCDVKKENAQVIQELNEAQVDLIHVTSTGKNAADDKLRQSMRRFADLYGSPSAVLLISGDVNFSSDLCDMRHRKKIHVILLHNDLCSQSLILCANENHNYTRLVETLPMRGTDHNETNGMPAEVLVTNLPLGFDPAKVRNRLKRLSENCGGRVGVIANQSTTIRFPSIESATRAQKRMNNERVFGNQVLVSSPCNLNSYKYEFNYNHIVNNDNNQNNSNNNNNNTQVFKKFNWKEYKECTGKRDKMYQYVHQGNIINTCYDSRNIRTFGVQNGLMGNGIGTTTTNVIHLNNNGYPNQENMILSTSAPPIPIPIHQQMWYCTTTNNTQHTLVSRSILGNCDGNVKCSPNQWDNTATSNNNNNNAINGTNDKKDNFQNKSYNFQQATLFNGPISILKRNPQPRGSAEFNECPITQNGLLSTPTTVSTSTFKPECNSTSVNVPAAQDKYFYPIVATSTSECNGQNGNGNQNGNANSPVELYVTNLDQTMESGEMKRNLLSVFREHITVLHFAVFQQSDGNYAASVKVPNLHSAQFVISKLHHKKIGYKRINIAYAHTGPAINVALLRLQTVSLLMDVPGYSLPMFKFRELFEKRYSISISLSDLFKIKDVCVISEDVNARRIVTLHQDHRCAASSPLLLQTSSDTNCGHDQPYCGKHWNPNKVNAETGWAELEMIALPNVKVDIQQFSLNIKSLISSHSNYLPLASLKECYEAECGQLESDLMGVPLEHLVTCVGDVELIQKAGSTVKYLCKSSGEHNNTDDKKLDVSSIDGSKSISPSLANGLALFSRELVDLLKTYPHCILSFNRFIPAYHHHFGRQCRVADYGYTRLIDLLESLSQVVQVIGEGNKKMITLSHKAQIRRFTSDLLRVLKSLASKQTTLSEFPSVFDRTLNRPFDPIDYGLCSLQDLLSKMSENTIVMSKMENDDTLIAIPKREQTQEEIQRTKVFAYEVVVLLSHVPDCSMLFNKFIPAYHHHYGHQCKVADFGFTKLIELFEAISHIVKIEDDPEGDRRVTLKEEVKMKVLAEQLVTLTKLHEPMGLPLNELQIAFRKQYGHALKPVSYGYASIEQLLNHLNFAINVIRNAADGSFILKAIDENDMKILAMKVRRVLWQSDDGKMIVTDFTAIFKRFYGQECQVRSLEHVLPNVVKVYKEDEVEELIELSDVEIFGRNVYNLLMLYNGHMALSFFETAYARMYRCQIQPSLYHKSSVIALIAAISHIVIIKGKHPKRTLFINSQLAAVGIKLPKYMPTCNSVNEDARVNQNQNMTNGGDNGEDFENKCNVVKTEIAPVVLPNLTVDPDAFNTSPLTSPYKGLPDTIMYAAHMLYADMWNISGPDASTLPMPKLTIVNNNNHNSTSNNSNNGNNGNNGKVIVNNAATQDNNTNNNLPIRKKRLAMHFPLKNNKY